MFFRKHVFAVLMGVVAMLALPVIAFAGDHDHWHHHRPYAWHGERWHNGWAEHEWRHYDWDDHRFGRPYGWNGYHRQCDRDGDDCIWMPNRPVWGYGYSPRWWLDSYPGTYRRPYLQPAPVYNSKLPGWLVASRHNTMQTVASWGARGDSRGAACLVPVVQASNQRISAPSGV